MDIDATGKLDVACRSFVSISTDQHALQQQCAPLMTSSVPSRANPARSFAFFAESFFAGWAVEMHLEVPMLIF